MPNLKELKERKKSVQSTRKITLAMKMIAGAKLKKAEQNMRKVRNYYEAMNDLVNDVATGMNDQANDGNGTNTNDDNQVNDSNGDTDHPLLFGNSNVERELLLVFSANRGLCGGFNGGVIRAGVEFLTNKSDAQIVCVGQKSGDFFKGRYNNVVCHKLPAQPVINDTHSIAAFIMAQLVQKKIGGVRLIYNHYHSPVNQEVISKQLTPMQPTTKKVESLESPGAQTLQSLYEFEPDCSEVLKQLLPNFLQTTILYAMMQTVVGEYGARVSAMDSASNNAQELINELALTYNRMRQAYITNELIEIMSGAEAMN